MVFTTIINMIGVKLMARINNFGVLAELCGVSVLIILLAFHIRRGPGVIFDTFGTGKGYPWGYFGAFLVAGLMSAYVMYGFDTAGSLAEETMDPRKHAPPAIIRALSTPRSRGCLSSCSARWRCPTSTRPSSAPPGCRTWSSRRWAAPRATCSWSTR